MCYNGQMCYQQNRAYQIHCYYFPTNWSMSHMNKSASLSLKGTAPSSSRHESRTTWGW